MAKSFRRAENRAVVRLLRGSVSAGALCAAAIAVPAFAQTGPAAQTDTTQTDATLETTANSQEIVVTGIRQSLANAQNIKRNSDTVVDAITAQDIGALPDRSVTEALQRVPGVSINRFAGTNDPDHFSVEGSGVVIRGLNFVRSEFNGRDAFSAGVGGQSLNFADVPSELLGTVEVYKNVTAAMIEGGLAGTVNLNTRKPFDDKGFHLAFDAEGNYGDMEKKWAPTGSLLVSDTWETGAGTFGLLADLSYSQLRSRSDGIQVTNYQTRDAAFVTFQSQGGQLICRNQLPGNTDTTTLPPAKSRCGAPETAGADGMADLMPVAYAPIGGQFRTQDYNRKRDGVALTGQWESTDHSVLATAQFIRSHTTNTWGEHTFETAPDLSEYNTYPAGCVQNDAGAPTSTDGSTTRAQCPVGEFTNYQYNDDGLFQSGFITLPGTGWRTAGSGSVDSMVPTGGIQQSLSRRQVREENTVNDFGMNLKITPADRWEIELDGDYTRSEHNNMDFSVLGSTFADEELDLTGDLPKVTPHKPLTLAADWATPNPQLVADSDPEYFADPDVQFWRAAMDHAEHSTGREYAFKGDFGYDLEGGFFKKLKFGARYADRDQTVRYTTYNWGVLSEVWAQPTAENPGTGAPVSINQAGIDQAELYGFPDFFRGQTAGPSSAFYYAGNLLKDYDQISGALQEINGLWHNVNRAPPQGNDWRPLADRVDAIPGSMFRPNEIQRVKQQDTNAYAMLTFASDTPIFGNVRLSGNFGVRYVHTDLGSFGTTRIPTKTDLGVTSDYSVRCAVSGPPAGAPAGTSASRPGGVCNLGPEGYALLQQFAGDTSTLVPAIAHNGYTYWLPSLNTKFGLTDNLLMRFAASKVLTRPESSYVRNYLDLSVDGNGNLVSNVGNPYLKPATAWQFDLTAEWYFSRVGSLTADLFYKDVKNFFYQAVVSLPITNNGVTFDQQTRGPANYDGHGKIKGFEIAYQQTLDFLPGFLSGIGVNANYSYVQSSGLPNTFLNTGSPVNTGTIPHGNLPLEGLSKHNVNATIFYEKGPISLRAAYNWRSKFMLTAADVIFPYTSIFQDATGQLDASAFVNVTKHIKIGVQGVNLTNTVTKTLQAYKGDPSALAPRSYFMNDRRYSLILRGSF